MVLVTSIHAIYLAKYRSYSRTFKVMMLRADKITCMKYTGKQMKIAKSERSTVG
jgi:hypothetical protein